MEQCEVIGEKLNVMFNSGFLDEDAVITQYAVAALSEDIISENNVEKDYETSEKENLKEDKLSSDKNSSKVIPFVPKRKP
jgi:hypothetical protein